ncbi:MAG: NlpC/P60 family protein, partial [Armatimonadota bacterium]|nr:NlpC/P60 family protein [Armatimonadota bacterium]
DANILRAANKLGDTKDTTVLPPRIFLHIPGVNQRGGQLASTLPSVASTPKPATTKFSGTIAKSLRHTVQPGDTLESIAERYAVTVQSLREKNNLTTSPVAGSTLLVPVGSMTYREAEHQVSARQSNTLGDSFFNSTGGTLEGGATLSEERPWPQAKVAPDLPPVYQAPNRRKPQPRMPSILGARGYFPSGSDGVRILGPHEEGTVATSPPPPRSRVIQAPATPQPQPRAMAQVAQVVTAGARIRRLPDADAVTLYRCPPGTELAVLRQSGPWSAILMSDRSIGWMPTRYLRFTGAEQAVDQISTNAADRSYSGRFTSNQPMVAQALNWLGTPYVYGGTSRSGIDCSALVQRAFSDCGYRLPRTAAEQYRVGQRVEAAQLQPGDRLYFSASGSRVDHTGLYMGDGLFVHASGRARGVVVGNLFDKAHWNIFVGAKR